jgi:tetratricopeptide (TPR) repeat protein
MKSELKGLNGLERAKLLDQLIVAYDKLKNPADDVQVWCKEIVAIDADNKAGLRLKYECRMMLADAEQLLHAKKFTEAIAVLEKGLAISGLTDGQKQEIYFRQASCRLGEKDLAATIACVEKGIEAAPRSIKAQQMKLFVKSLAAALEAQAFIAKNLDAAEKATGLERAKLLDQLVEANVKVAPYGVSKIEAEKIAAWREEIPKLDGDDKAGLKTKYQFGATVKEAGELAKEKKFDEAHAVLDKVLAVSGIGAEQRQQCWFYKGMFYWQAKDAAKAVECYQKALDAAPEGRTANIIRLFMQQAQKAQKPAAAAKKPEAKTEG